MQSASVTVGGEPLVLEKLYNVATKAYLALGRDGYTAFALAKVRVCLVYASVAMCAPPRLSLQTSRMAAGAAYCSI